MKPLKALYLTVKRRLGQLVALFLRLPLWFRLISPLITTGIGSGLLSIANTVAVYSYAYGNGFRMPVEGAPYVRMAVVSLSFVSGLSLLLLVFLTWLTVTWSRAYLRSPTDWQTTAAVVGASSALASVSGLLLGEVTSAISADNVWFKLMVTAGGIAAFLLVLWTLRSTVRTILAAVALYLAAFGVTAVGMLCPVYYGQFLSHIRFGGGTPVVLITKNRTSYTGELLLVTNTTYFLRAASVSRPEDNSSCGADPFDKEHEVTELPKSSVTEIRYLDIADHALLSEDDSQETSPFPKVTIPPLPPSDGVEVAVPAKEYRSIMVVPNQAADEAGTPAADQP